MTKDNRKARLYRWFKVTQAKTLPKILRREIRVVVITVTEVALVTMLASLMS